MPVSRSKKRTRFCCEDKDDFDPEVLFAQAATINFKNMLKDLELTKRRHVIMIQKCVEFARAQLPSFILEMPLREIQAMGEQEKKSLNKSESICVSPSFEGIRGRSTGFDIRSSSPPPPPKFLKPAVPARFPRRSSARNKLNYMTPGVTKMATQPITPKVNPDSPVGMLRVPLEGEFAVSASGSPLLVSSRCTGSANINIPLSNGKVVSVLPKLGVNTNSISGNLAPDIRRQLETLTHTLNAILRSYEDNES